MKDELKVFVLMLNDAVLGVYSTEKLARGAQEVYDREHVLRTGGMIRCFRIDRFDLDAKARL